MPGYTHHRESMLKHAYNGVPGYAVQRLVLHPETNPWHGGQSLTAAVPEYMLEGVRVWANAAAPGTGIILVLPRIEDVRHTSP